MTAVAALRGPPRPRGWPAVLLLGLFVGCGTGSDGAAPAKGGAVDRLTVYSGRNERLIAPVLERFTSATGIQVQVRYGSTSEMAATLMEEGGHTPADLFISQDAASLGALSRQKLLLALPLELVERVPPPFRSARGDWVGLSGRARVVVYNTERVLAEELPLRLDDVAAERYRGHFGIAPGNASFQAQMACYHALNGGEAARNLLEKMAGNQPLRYAKNTPIVEAVIAGEIDWGLVNHYYLWRALKENPDAPARNFFMPGGDCSGFVNVSGAALLHESPAAIRLVEFLLGEEAQRYFATETYEYPLAGGVEPSVDLPHLDALVVPRLDYGDLSEAFEPALELIDETGLNRF
jgi:iron(III) transport system substrate-binding protein